MSNQAYKTNSSSNHINLHNSHTTRTAAANTSNLNTANNNSSKHNRLLTTSTASHSNTAAAVNRAHHHNPHLKKLNQQSHSDSSNSFIRQVIRFFDSYFCLLCSPFNYIPIMEPIIFKNSIYHILKDIMVK